MPNSLPFSRTRAVIESSIVSGLSPGAQLYISQSLRPLVDLAFGNAQAGVPMTVDSLNLWMSATKPVAAVAIAQLIERRLLCLDDRVTHFIPEFGVNGKDPITIRHLLTHTAGFRAPPKSQEAPWEQLIAEMSAAKLETGWVPGAKAGYHPASSWYILGEIVHRTDGRMYSQYVREEIFEPIGMNDSWIGMSAEQFEAYGDRIASMHKILSNGTPVPLNARAVATSCRPGSSGWGPIHELGRFYEMLLSDGELASRRILSSESVATLTARHRTGMFDETFKQPIDWGLGFLLQSPEPSADLPYGYSGYASPRTFGHGGAESSGAFCDPDKRVVVAYVFNGQPGEAKHHERRRAMVAAIYEDLG